MVRLRILKPEKGQQPFPFIQGMFKTMPTEGESIFHRAYFKVSTAPQKVVRKICVLEYTFSK